MKFWLLFFGALIASLGNGTVEAACNPLIATIYPDKKTHRLNQFHMWFPGGIVIGGLISESELENVTRVPVLGYLPLLGLAFQNRSTENEKTEIVFLITPRVI